MQRLLLSSGQVSLLLSCIITITFTLLLFLTGLHLQHRTLTHLRTTLSPNLPPVPATHLTPLPLPPRRRDTSSPDHLSRQQQQQVPNLVASSSQTASPWSRLGHLQLVTDRTSLCSAVMFFADLHRARSPARRVLVFPAEWLEGLNEGGVGLGGGGGGTAAVGMKSLKREVRDPWRVATRRLLRVAGRRYGVTLRPVVVVEEDRGRKRKKRGWFGTAGSAGGEGQEAVDGGAWLRARAVKEVLGMRDLERVLMVRSPGWVVDAMGLDARLAYGQVEGVSLERRNGTGVGPVEALLLKTDGDLAGRLGGELLGPGRGERGGDGVVTQRELAALQKLRPGFVKEEEQEEEEEEEEEEGKGRYERLTLSIGRLHDPAVGDEFNATAYLASASYITFDDPKLPAGPEFDIPFAERRRARPGNKDADWAWTKLYGDFAERRREVCGMELEWYPSTSGA